MNDLARQFGVKLVYVPFLLAALLAGLALTVQGIAEWFTDRHS
jgi:hypothetical protein